MSEWWLRRKGLRGHRDYSGVERHGQSVTPHKESGHRGVGAGPWYPGDAGVSTELSLKRSTCTGHRSRPETHVGTRRTLDFDSEGPAGRTWHHPGRVLWSGVEEVRLRSPVWTSPTPLQVSPGTGQGVRDEFLRRWTWEV